MNMSFKIALILFFFVLSSVSWKFSSYNFKRIQKQVGVLTVALSVTWGGVSLAPPEVGAIPALEAAQKAMLEKPAKEKRGIIEKDLAELSPAAKKRYII